MPFMSTPNPLAEYRRRVGLSVVEASAACEISRGHWYALEAGRCLPQPVQAQRIAAETGVTRSQLAAWQEAHAAPLAVAS